MYFTNLPDLFYMNGHGAYVWSAYGIGFAVLLALVWQPLARHAALRQQILRQLSTQSLPTQQHHRT